MRTLFALLWKYQFYFLFVILEIISLFLLANSYSYHRSLAFNTTNDFTGKIYEFSDGIASYFRLESVNTELLQENTMLRHQLASSFLETDTNVVFRDSLYRFIPAGVVSNTTNRQNNFILINKGARHGIQKEMGVISSNGLTGIVVGVSEHYAYVMSMLHQNSRISARIKTSGQLVNVVWDGKSPDSGILTDIPSHVVLNRGDSIVTSGNSLIFPKNILIGTAIDQEISRNKALGSGKLEFATDFDKLVYVYVIENLMKKEQDQLMNSASDE